MVRQNGAYWATPLSYITAAMIGTGHADFAEELLAEAIADFKLRGTYYISCSAYLPYTGSDPLSWNGD